MPAEHFDQVVKGLLEQRPFRPFTVELNTRQLVEVDFPGSLAMRDGFAIYLKPGG